MPQTRPFLQTPVHIASCSPLHPRYVLEKRAKLERLLDGDLAGVEMGVTEPWGRPPWDSCTMSPGVPTPVASKHRMWLVWEETPFYSLLL
jgi:hypothetical protein